MTPLIQIENLSKSYGVVRALEDISFDIRAGEIPAAKTRLDQALEQCGESSMAFLGPQLYATLARVQTDPLLQTEMLARGEATLVRGAVSHNYFVFCDAAIQVSLGMQNWTQAERYCDMLELYAQQEPFPWADFLVSRGRALRRAGQGETSAKLLAELQRLRAVAAGSSGSLYLADIDAALAGLGAV